jgi:cellulose synthase/poly-beta-1,6-N-acetylglucosamine synthase-like glycosyltransferase
MEVVVRLHRQGRGYRVAFVPDPVCWTQVPEDWRSLLRQRDRWQRGLLETLWMHRSMLLRPRYGAVGMFGFPFYLLFEALGPVIEALGYCLLPILLQQGLIDTSFAIVFLVLAVLYGILITPCAMILDDLLFRRYERPLDLARLLLATFTEYLGFRQLLALQRALSFVTVFFREAHWGKAERQAIAHTEKTSPAGGRS